MMIKTCFKCRLDKPLTEFYRHKMMADGRLGKCKPCTRRDVRANCALRIEQYRAFDKGRAMRPERVAQRESYASSPAGKASAKKTTAAWRAANPEKRAAHGAVAYALRLGVLEKKPCDVCGATRVHGHHDDYQKQLDVVWLCAKHHNAHHKETAT